MKTLIILITFSLLITNKLFAETELYQSVELIVQGKSPLSKQISEGRKAYYIINNERLPIKRIKAKDYIPTGSLI